MILKSMKTYSRIGLGCSVDNWIRLGGRNDGVFGSALTVINIPLTAGTKFKS
jgi:hypothetical protein